MPSLQRDQIDGRWATIAYLSKANGELVDPEHATVAIAKFDNGQVVYLTVTPETSLALPVDTVITMPFAEYDDFADCVEKNQDKDDPKAFCGWLKHRIEGSAAAPTVMLSYRDKLLMEMAVSRAATPLGYRDKLAAISLDWSEDAHPRDDHGRFSDGGGGTLSGAEAALQKRLVDFKEDRNLTGPRSQAITDVIPGSTFIPYVKVPGLDTLHAAMGVKPTLETNPLEYQAARDALFARQPTKDIPLSKLTLTQPRVNKDRVESIATAPAQLDKPVQILKMGDQYFVMNGHHRVAGSQHAGRTTVAGQVFDVVKHLSDSTVTYRAMRERFLLDWRGV
jgi:hypothetical protein